MREKMGLTKEQAEKIIKGVQNQRLGASLQSAKATGQLDLQKILDMKDAGVDVDTFVSEEMRLTLYTKEIQNVLSSGQGDFDAERLLQQLPQDLNLPEKKVKQTIQEQAKDKKRTTLVQAVSFLRQRKLDDTVKSLNNLLACSKALPSDQPAQWSEREELQDLYSVYVAKQHDDSKQEDLQKLFGLSDKEASSLREVVESGQFKIEEEEKEESFF
jgi:hypothetical protein